MPRFFIHIVTLLLPMSHFTIKRYSYFPFSKGKRGMIVFLASKLLEFPFWYSRVSHFSSGVKARSSQGLWLTKTENTSVASQMKAIEQHLEFWIWNSFVVRCNTLSSSVFLDRLNQLNRIEVWVETWRGNLPCSYRLLRSILFNRIKKRK